MLLALKILIKFFDSNIFIVGGISLGIATLFYYAIVIINSDIINFKKIIRLISSIALSLIFITISIVNTLSLFSFKMIVSGDKDMSLTVFSENNKNVAIITEFSNNFSYYRLNRIKERENVNILNAVIIQDDCTVNDVFSLTTRLSYLFKIERIIVFKIVEPNIIESFNKSFPNVELIYALNGEVYSDFVSVKYSDYNRVVSVENKKTSVSIYPKYSGSDSVEFSKNNKADYVIGYNNLPLIFNEYNAQKISYLKSDEFIDAESQGNLKYYFSKG